MDDVQKIILDQIEKLNKTMLFEFRQVNHRIDKINQFKYKVIGGFILCSIFFTIAFGVSRI